jgi:hypothetical protein
MEKIWKEVPPQFFTATGTSDGVVTVNSSSLFKLRQFVVILNPGQPSVVGEIKAILSDTRMAIGPQDSKPSIRIDLSSYDTSSTISAPEQQRPAVAQQDIERYVYEEAPVMANRQVPVDDTGNIIKFVRSEPGGPKSLGVNVDHLTFSEFNEARVTDSFQGAAQGQAILLNSATEPMEAKGGLTPLSNRKGVFIMPIDKKIYMGFSNSVTISNGMPIFISQMVYVPAAANQPVWLVADVNGTPSEVRVWEVG